MGPPQGDRLGLAVEAAGRVVEDARPADHDLVVAGGHDQEARVGQLAVERNGMGNRDEHVAIAAGQQRRQPDPAQLVRREERLPRHIGGDGRQQAPPGAGALALAVALLELVGPIGILAVDARWIHEASRDARPRLALDVDAHEEQGAQALRVARCEGQGCQAAQAEADQVEGLQAEPVREGAQVGHQLLGREPLRDIPAGAAMAPGIGQVDAEGAPEGGQLRREVLAPRARRSMQHDHRRSRPLGRVLDREVRRGQDGHQPGG